MSKNNSNALVSVIVPTFKRHALLLKTLESILGQTHRQLELLVVSDGEDDQTRSIVKSLNDARVKYLHVEHAGLPAAPRNEGLRQSQGNYLAFCDDDDLWYPNKLEQQLPVMASGQYSMCTTDYDYIDQNGVRLDQENYYSGYYGEFDWQTFYHSMGFICNAAGLFTREIYEKVGEQNESKELRAHEDFEYWMRMLFEQNGFFMDEILVAYRVHVGSIQKNTPWRVFRSRWELHRALKHSLPISNAHHYRKNGKLLIHYLFDAVPITKTFFRRIQGRS